MRLNKFLITSLLIAVFATSCDNDDDPGAEPIPERDRSEQEEEDREALEEYLQTHFYNYEEFENPSEDFDYRIRIDTINEANADKTPIFQSDLLETKTVTRDDVDYNIYILKVREGEGMQPTFADSTFISYTGQLLNRSTFDSAITPIWFDLPGYETRNTQGQVVVANSTIPGMTQAITEFRGASDFEVEPDGTTTWTDYGIGAVFMPSGLGYFSSAISGIPAYSPLVFSFHLLRVNEADHDNDGIPSRVEDLDGDRNLRNHDTDGDRISNYSDTDDDGDFIPTREEIIINEDGGITYTDTDNDGTPDYLDPDS